MSEQEQEPQEQPEQEPEQPEEPEEQPEEESPAEPPEQPERPAEEPQARSQSDLAMERRHAAAERKWREHEKRVRTIFEEESEFLYDCPLCAGSHPGLIDIRFAGQIPNELAEQVVGYMRGAEQVKYAPAENVSECPVCSGYGKVLSGSKVAGKDLITCVSCKGYGFVPPPGISDNGRVEDEFVMVGVGGEDGPLSTENNDIWGTPHFLPDGQENPNWGRSPQYKDPRFP